MKHNSDFPGELSKWILLINFLLTTSWQGCRLIRNPSPRLGSYPDLGTHGRSPQIGNIWQLNVPDEAAWIVRKCRQLGMNSPAQSQALSSLLPSLPANKRALSADQRHFLAAELGQLKSEVEIRTPGSQLCESYSPLPFSLENKYKNVSSANLPACLVSPGHNH